MIKPADLDYQDALLILVKVLALRNGSDTITINYADQQEIFRTTGNRGFEPITPTLSTWQDGLDIIVQLEYPDVRDS
jgi:hypothetical protein